MTSVGPVHVTGHDLTDRDLFPPDDPDPPPECQRCGEPCEEGYSVWCERCTDTWCGWERA